MDNAQNEAVTVTDTETDKHTELNQAELLVGLKGLDAYLVELKNAGMMGKAEKAEKVINQAREVIAGTVIATHKLFNEVKRARADIEAIKENLNAQIEGMKAQLEHFKKYGFGG